jgi:hypothetical protein
MIEEDMQTLIDLLGWVGTVLFLTAYALVSLNKVKGDSLLFQGMNIVAGIFLVTNTIYWKAYPSTALNLAWVGIAIFTLGRKYAVQK